MCVMVNALKLATCRHELAILLRLQLSSGDNAWPREDNARDFLGGPLDRNLPANAGDTGLIPVQGNSDPMCLGATEPARLSY